MKNNKRAVCAVIIESVIIVLLAVFLILSNISVPKKLLSEVVSDNGTYCVEIYRAESPVSIFKKQKYEVRVNRHGYHGLTPYSEFYITLPKTSPEKLLNVQWEEKNATLTFCPNTENSATVRVSL